MPVTTSYALPRFGRDAAAHLRSERSGDTQAEHTSTTNTPADRVDLSSSKTASDKASNTSSLWGRLRLFEKRIRKATKGLTASQEPNPELKLALKRFTKSIQKLANSPDLAETMREQFIKANEEVLAISDLTDAEKKEFKEDLHKAITPDVAKQALPHAVTSMFNSLSDVTESGEVEKGLKETFEMLPRMIVQVAALQQQAAAAAEHAAQTQGGEEPSTPTAPRTFFNSEPSNAAEIRRLVKQAREEKKSDQDIADMVQSKFYTEGITIDRSKPKKSK